MPQHTSPSFSFVHCPPLVCADVNCAPVSSEDVPQSLHCLQVTGEDEEFGLTEMMEALGATPFDSVGPIPPRLVRHDNHLYSEIMSEDPDKPDTVRRPGPLFQGAPECNSCLQHAALLLALLSISSRAAQMQSCLQRAAPMCGLFGASLSRLMLLVFVVGGQAFYSSLLYTSFFLFDMKVD